MHLLLQTPSLLLLCTFAFAFAADPQNKLAIANVNNLGNQNDLEQSISTDVSTKYGEYHKQAQRLIPMKALKGLVTQDPKNCPKHCHKVPLCERAHIHARPKIRTHDVPMKDCDILLWMMDSNYATTAYQLASVKKNIEFIGVHIQRKEHVLLPLSA